ncbi:MAG: hypothetical protein D6805_04115 [Planctomycetota bacterium]|nr:MAG: hypothetical protein D6805_04115 [Planctomycetota bacterium]
MLKKQILPLLLPLLLCESCSQPRFVLVYIGKKSYHPQFVGEIVPVQVLDTELEQFVRISYFTFEMSPPNWAEIYETNPEKKLGELKVKTLFSSPFNDVQYHITPILRQEAPYQ